MPLRLALLTAELSSDAAGVWAALSGLGIALGELGMSVGVIGMRDRSGHAVETALGERLDVTVPLQHAGPRALAWCPGMPAALARFAPDVVHTHGLWLYNSLACLRHHRAHRTPYVVQPHGMLDPWALRSSGWKKRVAGLLFEHRHLHGAGVLHALNEAEYAAIRACGLTNPVCIVPNGVEPVAAVAGSDAGAGGGPRRLLFLGRLHPKKGVTELLEGWALAGPATRGWRLVVAGGGEPAYVRRVRARARALGVDDDVDFTGPVQGAAKAALYRDADAFILPSHSEGLPMSVLEAWAHGLPVLMSPQCNLPDGYARDAAIRISPDPAGVRAGLNVLLAMATPGRREMGARGRALVAERYTWPRVAASMLEVYRWLAGGAPRPACVELR